MHTNCLEKPLVKLFSRYGSIVGAWPVIFLLFSLAASAGLGVGFLYFEWEVGNSSYVIQLMLYSITYVIQYYICYTVLLFIKLIIIL